MRMTREDGGRRGVGNGEGKVRVFVCREMLVLEVNGM
jgi:hypothetical protein